MPEMTCFTLLIYHEFGSNAKHSAALKIEPPTAAVPLRKSQQNEAFFNTPNCWEKVSFDENFSSSAPVGARDEKIPNANTGHLSSWGCRLAYLSTSRACKVMMSKHILPLVPYDA